ncbi:hypothetical protein CRV24_000728 [Beauveria bassiana]|nr:hypothetical protein CRV24_000728 [Beauveria bassiana]
MHGTETLLCSDHLISDADRRGHGETRTFHRLLRPWCGSIVTVQGAHLRLTLPQNIAARYHRRWHVYESKVQVQYLDMFMPPRNESHIYKGKLMLRAANLFGKIAIVPGQLRLPEHGTAVVGQIHGLDALEGLDEGVGVNITLIAVGPRGQAADEELGAADALAPVLDGCVEARLRNVAVAVVVKLHPNVVEQLADCQGLRLVRKRALRRRRHVVLFAAARGHVGAEALGHCQINTVEVDVAKRTQLLVIGAAEEQVPNLVGHLFALRVAAQAGYEPRTVLETRRAGLALRSRGPVEARHLQPRIAAGLVKVGEEGQVDNVVRGIVAHVHERQVVVLGAPVHGQFAARGARAEVSALGGRGGSAERGEGGNGRDGRGAEKHWMHV